MSSNKEWHIGKSCPQFKTTAFCQLWKQYTAMEKTSLKNTALFRLSFSLLLSTEQDRFLCLKRKDCETLSSSQRQTWSMFKSFGKLFSVPVIYCDSGQASGQVSESVSGSDLMERNNNAFMQKQIASGSYKGVTYTDVTSYINNETGWERLKAVFEKDGRGKTSPELYRIFNTQTVILCFGIGYCMGISGLDAREDFIQKNQTTVFPTKGLAMRKLMDWVFTHSIKGAYKLTRKYLVFPITLLTIAEGIAIYRNKTSIFEYIIVGGVAVSAMRGMEKGLGQGVAVPKVRRMAQGLGQGFTLGALIGLVVTSLLESKNTQEERHFRQMETLLKGQLVMSKQLHKPMPEEDIGDY